MIVSSSGELFGNRIRISNARNNGIMVSGGTTRIENTLVTGPRSNHAVALVASERGKLELSRVRTQGMSEGIRTQLSSLLVGEQVEISSSAHDGVLVMNNSRAELSQLKIGSALTALRVIHEGSLQVEEASIDTSIDGCIDIQDMGQLQISDFTLYSCSYGIAIRHPRGVSVERGRVRHGRKGVIVPNEQVARDSLRSVAFDDVEEVLIEDSLAN